MSRGPEVFESPAVEVPRTPEAPREPEAASRWWPDLLALVVGAAVALVLLGSASRLAAGFAVVWWIPVIVIIRSDLDGYIIPDLATAAIAGLGLVYLGASALAAAPDPSLVGWAMVGALATGAAAFGLFWLVGRLHQAWSGRDGLGFGDVKLAGASALWLTPADGIVALEIAAVGALLLALASRRSAPVRDVAIPFGAFLAPAAWLVFVAGPGVRTLLDP